MARRLWPLAWPAFLTSTTAVFAVLEWWAYRRGTHLTLSRWLAKHMGCQPRRPHGRITPYLFAGAWAGLAVHIARLKAEPQ